MSTSSASSSTARPATIRAGDVAGRRELRPRRATVARRGMLGVVEHGSTVGQLLIAEPMLGDPNFDRTVVLMIEHTPEGALGVVLNRPTELDVDAVLGDWAGLAASPQVLYLGGPVEQNGVLA